MKIIGHQKQWQYLKKSAELDKLPHAFLFSGPEKLGKKTLAMEFVRWLFKEDIAKREHPDFIFISPIKKDYNPPTTSSHSSLRSGWAPIQIFQIRDCIWRLSLKPSVALFKVAIIDQAHCMNQEAQNCFLKTLEEPKGNALLILITEYPELLFPTILSRVQKIRFYPPNSAEIKDYLKERGFGEKESAEILKLSLGKPGQVLDFISDPQKLISRRKTRADLVKILNSDLSFRFQYVKELAKKQPRDLKEILEIWLGYFREIVISSLKEPSPKYSFGKIKKPVEFIQNMNFLLSVTNVNPRLALENLMLEI